MGRAISSSSKPAGRIARIDPETGATFTVAEDLAIGAEGPSVLPPTWAFNGIAVGRGGWIYATSDIEGSVYRILPAARRRLRSARQP